MFPIGERYKEKGVLENGFFQPQWQDCGRIHQRNTIENRVLKDIYNITILDSVYKCYLRGFTTIHRILHDNTNYVIHFRAQYTRCGVFNIRNTHLWASRNLYATYETHFQERFGVNVWAGILDNYIIGPHFLPYTLIGESYLYFLREELSTLLDEVPYAIRRIIFQHEAAQSHFTRRARDFFEWEWTVLDWSWMKNCVTSTWPYTSRFFYLVVSRKKYYDADI